ncbi:hypothetical protein C8Q69DRAFT_330282 [Paecilomyces variotii]|uniref:Uncharacterized protein n=1 Tax=Byssochlamys spectabilis TaxID=264951 RepID=A0A443HP80_BYSSP|nr:hypothetical protein C8Q69DRAFT_330282 [Paecilomyces variotii]RWQ93643.1 hypothetical protein C8Q69DRAFT_330282 [Paecilomyces variotii]
MLNKTAAAQQKKKKKTHRTIHDRSPLSLSARQAVLHRLQFLNKIDDLSQQEWPLFWGGEKEERGCKLFYCYFPLLRTSSSQRKGGKGKEKKRQKGLSRAEGNNNNNITPSFVQRGRCMIYCIFCTLFLMVYSYRLIGRISVNLLSLILLFVIIITILFYCTPTVHYGRGISHMQCNNCCVLQAGTAIDD